MENLFDLLDDEETEEKQQTEKKVAHKKKEEPKKKAAAKEKQQKAETTYTYPFGMYIDGKIEDISHIFEEGKTYTADQISKEMLKHGYYYFAGNVIFDYITEDKMLVPTFQKHSKG